MKLGKPPVVEVSIEYLFETPPASEGWDIDKASEFADQFQTDYPELEYSSQHFVEAEPRARGKKPSLVARRVPVAVRSFPSDRSRYLLTSKDLLRCTFLRTAKKDYEGFAALKHEALGKLAAYVDFFRPARLIAVVVRYMDFFRIPAVDGKVALKTYFTLCAEPDEAIFGTTVMFRKGFATKPPESDDILTCELANVPRKTSTDEPGIYFRMEWGLHAFKELTWDAGPLAERLDRAHSQLLKCFRESFTSCGWALFEPQEEGGTA